MTFFTPAFGYQESPPDTRDYPIDALYAARALTKPIALPSWYVAPYLNPVLNQGNTPMCVAYHLAGIKMWQDRADQKPTRWWNFDAPKFFKLNGGTANGLVLRDALKWLTKNPYPLSVGAPAHPANTGLLGGYYSIPITRYEICAAILTFGPISCGVNWPDSWSRPAVPKVGSAVLPAPSGPIAGHGSEYIGWNTVGLLGQNTWGFNWPAPKKSGRFIIPWKYVIEKYVREAWKVTDAA